MTSTDPLNNATGVARNKVVAINFNEAMDPLTINTSTLTLTLKQGTTEVSGTVAYSGTTGTFTPSTILAADMADPTPINLTTAVENMITAYNDAAGCHSPDFSELGAGNIGGKTLTPGLYKSIS